MNCIAKYFNLKMLKKRKSFIIKLGDIEFKMIHVEGGTFTMGATDKDPFNYDEVPAHQVTLSNYSIGETPVTQALWKAVMGSNPSGFKGDNNPVENVSWYDCQDFIEKLNAMTGKNFRLPTEAEWEFAAQGGKESKGYEYSGSNNINEVAWYKHTLKLIPSSPDYGTHPVKMKKPNELGIYDMSGNVYEWCQDWWCRYNSDSQINPTGPATGLGRYWPKVYRGGYWSGVSDRSCRSTYRDRNDPVLGFCFVGFRLALSE